MVDLKRTSFWTDLDKGVLGLSWSPLPLFLQTHGTIIILPQLKFYLSGTEKIRGQMDCEDRFGSGHL